jgi:DNA helicase HerA-like ATPase
MAKKSVDVDGKIYVGKATQPAYLTLKLANRHGIATGATGTGKTVTLQVLAEGFSRAGVPVFAADIKGDLSGVAAPGEGQDWVVKRCKDIGIEYQPDEFPVVFWDLFGEQGHPIRTTIMEMGPLLLSRMLGLNEVQEGVVNVAFRFADDDPQLGEAQSNGLVDLKDLRELLSYISANSKEISSRYGNVATGSVGAVQRQLLVLENQGGEKFFGEPAFSIDDLMRTDRDGRGVINLLAADKLMENPRLYSTFLLWLLSELFEELPEVGDTDKPKLVFFFDEAHLLFDEAPKALVDKIEQVVRLIRSKGVGVYFVTQNPIDVPDEVLAQLGNRVQHALRAYTPREQKSVRAAAEAFRPNPKIKTERVITELGKGEALVSFLEGNGVPAMVDRCLVRAPSARVGPLSADQRRAVIAKSPVKGKYDTPVDPESAWEMLRNRTAEAVVEPSGPARGQAPGQPPPAQPGGGVSDWLGSIFGTNRKRGERLTTGQRVTREVTRTVTNRVAGQIAADIGKSLGGSVGGSIGRAIVRGTLGGLLRR